MKGGGRRAAGGGRRAGFSRHPPPAARHQEGAVAEEVIGGYRLLKHMATGQTTQVWEVVEVSSHRHFAMKLLLPERVRSPEYRKVLFHEAEVARQLTHPNIIKVAAIIRDPDNPCFVME